MEAYHAVMVMCMAVSYCRGTHGPSSPTGMLGRSTSLCPVCSPALWRQRARFSLALHPLPPKQSCSSAPFHCNSGGWQGTDEILQGSLSAATAHPPSLHLAFRRAAWCYGSCAHRLVGSWLMEARALQRGASASISWPRRLLYESVY